MKRLGPLLTLAAVAVLGGGLLIADLATDPNDDVTAPRAAATSTAPAQPAAAPTSSAPVVPTTSAAFPAQAEYVAVISTESRPITLSVTVTGKQAVAYACDGVSVESWLRGAADAGRMSLTGKNSALQAMLVGDSLSGTLTLNNRERDFTAPLAKAPAGSYVARSDAGRDSWIVRPDGSVTGVRQLPDGSTAPAPSLAPDARKVHGDDTYF